MPYGMSRSERSKVWMAYIAMDPSDAKLVYVGSQRIWRTRDAGTHWAPISPVFDYSTVTVIEPAAADGRVIYVGTENGGVFRSRDGGETWSSIVASAALPAYSITRIESNPRDARQVYACVANFGHSLQEIIVLHVGVAVVVVFHLRLNSRDNRGSDPTAEIELSEHARP